MRSLHPDLQARLAALQQYKIKHASLEKMDTLFQEAGTTCVECPACGARRTLKSPKDRPHFPSHPRRLTLPPKGERRWIERKEIWKVVED